LRPHRGFHVDLSDLTDLCGIPTPKHVEGPSIRGLLADPKSRLEPASRDDVSVQEPCGPQRGWRYIHYANGDEEL